MNGYLTRKPADTLHRTSASRKWLSSCSKHLANPCIAAVMVVSKPIDSSRVRGTQLERIERFYEGFDV